MDTLNDWLRLFGIQPPADYINSSDNRLFGHVAVEASIDFVQKNRRPKLCNGLASQPQLLGPNVILLHNQTSGEVKSKLLQGAGTVEQILAKVINQSVLMSPNKLKPSQLDFYVPVALVIADFEIDILKQTAKAKRSVVGEEEEGTFFLTVDATNFQMTFWIGVTTIEEAHIFRENLTTL
jgi:hypothetical protein